MKRQNSLFETPDADSPRNWLPKDGCVNYFPGVMNEQTCSILFETLRSSLDWHVDQLRMFGQLITTKREVAWVGDQGCSYTYSGVKKEPQAWTPELLSIKNTVEQIAGWTFNACLLNLYHDGNQGMGWHSDDEKELQCKAPIASVSLGGTRKFAFKHKIDKSSSSLLLESGSVLIMHAPTQTFWHHSLLKTKRPTPARINLTFRSIA